MKHPQDSLLDSIHFPSDIRVLDRKQLVQLADELRQETISVVSEIGGHLGAGLGVVELTVALHYIFNTPDDRLIWDVGHQTYPHKILTGRRHLMRHLRQGGGLSGFTKRTESIYDPFGAGHSSTSISAGLGMAISRDLKGEDNHIITVIGDGAMSAGMAYEAMNNAGILKSRLIVILNDNNMSIAPPVGAMSAYLARLLSSRTYHHMRDTLKNFNEKMPYNIQEWSKKIEEYMRGFITGGTLFEEMGFYYVGVVNGHHLNDLLPVLENIRDYMKGPVLLHVVTQKGYGYTPAEMATDKYHSVSRFNVVTGEQSKVKNPIPNYTSVFAETLIEVAADDKKIVAITAAMPDGTGLDKFAKIYPERCFDVGIAEQHAVTFAAGMATEGFKPFVAIYSTFLQRAYDQIIHDVAIQKLPVRFAIDRAGLVGADGATHAGSFDLSYLGILPNIILMAPADEAELVAMIKTGVLIDDQPSAFRFPRGTATGLDMPDVILPLEIGKGRVVREGTHIALLSLGTRLGEAQLAADMLQKKGYSVTVADARFMKPLDTDLLLQLVHHHEVLVTLEEGSQGGFSTCVLHYLAQKGLLDGSLKIRNLTLPDRFIDHDDPIRMYDDAGLNATQIVQSVLRIMP